MARHGSQTAPRVPAAAALAITIGVYFLCCSAEFVTWDDPIHVYDNPGLKWPTLSTLAAFWAHPYQDLYIPLTYSLWWLVALVGRVPAAGGGMELNPWVFHTLNVLLQCGSVVLVWRLLRELVGNDWAAAAGALLWGVHPLQVESVAWVSAMKDQLCGLLTLSALIAFAPAPTPNAMRPNRGKDVWATVFFAAALLAKPAAVVAPLIAIILVRYFPHRPRRWRWLAVWLGLALVDVVITSFAQPVSAPADGGRWWLRPLLALDSLQFYMLKLVAPVQLAIQYDRAPAAVIAHEFGNCLWLIPLLVIAGTWMLRKRAPWFAAGLLIFIAGLLPVLGLVPFLFQDRSAVADHYAHLALLGPALVAACALNHTPVAWRKIAWSAAAIGLFLFAGLSWLQTRIWQNNVSLYSYTLQINPHSWVAANNLGAVLQSADQDQAAIPLFEQALRYETHNSALYGDYANSLAKTGQFARAEQAYRTALRLDPESASIKANWQRMRELRQQAGSR